MKYRGLDLDGFQEQAIQYLDNGQSVLVAAPTGTGKTIIADWIVDEAMKTNRRVIYTAPVKALSNQKYRDYTRLHGDKVGLVTGDLVIRRDAPCLVMTTEILRNMLLSGDELDDLLAVIVDEIHFLDDRERGTVWEEVLIYLPPSVQIVGLSATLSNLGSFADWLSEVRGSEVQVVIEETRAVPLTLHLASVDLGMWSPEEYDKRWRNNRHRTRASRDKRRNNRGRNRDRRRGRGRPKRRTSHIDLFWMAKERDLLPYLYFVFSRADTESCARGLSRHLDESLLNAEEAARMEDRLREAAVDLGPALDRDLMNLYRDGVAFHHAGLHVQLKALVEELYEAKLIKALYCTSTFALGINMPARTVIFDGLHKYDGRSVKPLATRQFMQKAGRAGRRGLDDEGHVIVRVDIDDYDELRPHLNRYQKGAYEPVRSSFNLSWNSVVSLLDSHPQPLIREIVEKSFLNWHLSNQAQGHLERADVLEDEAQTNKQRKEVRRLRRRAEQAEGRVWHEYLEKVSYLQGIGYLDEDMNFNAGAKVLLNLQIAEIFTTELVLQGLFDELSLPELFGIACAMTNELGRRVTINYKISRDVRRIGRMVQQVRFSPVVEGAEQVSNTEVVWDPDLIALGKAWAEGKSLQEVLMMVHSETDISGDIIVGFRRAKDLIGQLRDVYIELPERAAALKGLMKNVSRDEILVVG